jgi:hypothetical protein
MSPHAAPKKTVLSRLVQVRLDDASALLKTGKPEQRNAAMYLSGYAAECALKASLCRRSDVDMLPPDFRNHDLKRLAVCAGADNWAKERREELSFVYSEWRVEMRYELRSFNAAHVKRFLQKVREFSEWLLSESRALSFQPSRMKR